MSVTKKTPQQKKHPIQRLALRRVFIALLILAELGFLILTVAYYAQLRWVSVLFRVLGFLTALHLLIVDQPESFKLSMVFLILLFPIFGGVLYWVFHYQTTTIGYRRRLHKIEQASAPAFRLQGNFAFPAELQVPESNRLIYYLDRSAGFPVYANTETRYFPDGKEYMDALLRELKKANRYIFLEYFIIGEGVFWDSVLKILCERREAGVDVRVIYDDVGSLFCLPHKYEKKLREAGIECHVFNPFRPFLSSVQNNRDHRKIAVIDGRVAFTGGINLADEYINEKERFGHWKDAGILLRGEGAWSFTVMFLQMWSFLIGKPENCEWYLPDTAESSPITAEGWVQPYTDSPMDHENVGEQVYLHLIANAKRYLYITTPYLMIDRSMLAGLKLAAKSGVDVRIILPHTPDKRAVHFTSRSYYRELVASGVRIYEYARGFIHSKNMISDDRIATVGTVNLDFRSLYLHFECGTCLYRTDSIPALKEDFLSTLEACHEITAKDCKCNRLVSFWQEVCRLFAPLM